VIKKRSLKRHSHKERKEVGNREKKKLSQSDKTIIVSYFNPFLYQDSFLFVSMCDKKQISMGYFQRMVDSYDCNTIKELPYR
jgi:hypothetical protein